MVDVAKVRMFGQDIGTFVWEDSYRVARFEYDKDFTGRTCHANKPIDSSCKITFEK